MTKKEQLNALIRALAVDLVPTVSKIEASAPTTQDHYGAYLSILTVPDDEVSRKLMALVLIEAGANLGGVTSAMDLF